MENNYLYSQPVLDLIAISAEFCKQVEQTEGEDFETFANTMMKILPLLYLKASQIENLPQIPGFLEQKVTEEDYNFVQFNIAKVLKEKDDYLDVFVEDFKYSDQPILQTISENLADIYQVLRELLEAFREEYEESMQMALAETIEQFQLYWGQTLLNALRALHDAKFGGNRTE